MTRYLIVFGSAALLSLGCVPVTEPVGDIDKAEPDKALVGTWGNENKTLIQFAVAPAVKGNPKGLMTRTELADPKKSKSWFFVSTVGKQKYGNFCCNTGDEGAYANFGTEGAYEKWAKDEPRLYLVFQYTIAKNELVLNHGDEKAFVGIADEAKLTKTRDIFYVTPNGWLAKYLEKNGSDAIYPPKEAVTYTRKPSCDP